MLCPAGVSNVNPILTLNPQDPQQAADAQPIRSRPLPAASAAIQTLNLEQDFHLVVTWSDNGLLNPVSGTRVINRIV